MEMRKKPTSTNKARITPTPFSASTEREELECALLSPSTTASSSQNCVVPTAVPIIAGDVFDENGVPVAAMAVAAPTMVSLPPPPTRSSASASNRTKKSNVHYQHQKSATASEKSESFLEDDVIVQPMPPTTSFEYQVDNSYYPTAPTLPTHTTNLPSTEQFTTSMQLRAANVKGGISSEEEFGDVARGRRERGALRYNAENKVRDANKKAANKAWRRDEGLTVDEGIHNLNLKSGEEEGDDRENQVDDDVRPYGNRSKGGKMGYEVKEYDTSEYATSEYDYAEYKSVYD